MLKVSNLDRCLEGLADELLLHACWKSGIYCFLCFGYDLEEQLLLAQSVHLLVSCVHAVAYCGQASLQELSGGAMLDYVVKVLGGVE